jgi:ankyrin repeat protein
MRAAQFGHTLVVETLVVRAEVNLQSNVSATASSVSSKHSLVLSTLTCCVAAWLIQDGCTALMYASRRGDVWALRSLLQAKADVNAQNKVRITAALVCSAAATSLLLHTT